MNTDLRRGTDDGAAPLPSAASYPLPAYLQFVPGGIQYKKPERAASSSVAAPESHYYNLHSVVDPNSLIDRAAQCDIQFNSSPVENGATGTTHTPTLLPSLSVLTEAILHPLTGLPATQVRTWLDSILVHYAGLDESTRSMLATLDEQLQTSQHSPVHQRNNSSGSGRSYSRSSSAGSAASMGANSPMVTSSLAVSSLSDKNNSTKTLQSLMTHLKESTMGTDGPRPCGYVFRRGDIAWNCRTCQTDSTCVLCDKCFHGSDHEGHEVFFHRTSPGGCCDCGDVEAWRAHGCCPTHRPRGTSGVRGAANNADATWKSGGSMDSANGEENGTLPPQEFEAVRAAARAKEMTQENMLGLPPALRSALGVVIGAAVQCVLKAVDGCGVGADLSQWRLRWSEQIASLVNGVAHEEEYALLHHPKHHLLTPQAALECANQISLPQHSTVGEVVMPSGSLEDDVQFSPQIHLTRSGESSAGLFGPLQQQMHQQLPSSSTKQAIPAEWEGAFPDKFKLHLRLHNDDVHTFDEVIDALLRPSRRTNNSDAPSIPLIQNDHEAESMTHHVDTDGQVTVSCFDSIPACVAGFTRLKQCGLLCSAVSTPQVDLELRARAILKWLADLVKLHPALSGIVVHALVDVTGGEDDFDSLCQVWPEARMLCPWENDTTQRGPSSHPILYTRETLRKKWLLHSQQSRGQQPPSDLYSNVPYHLPSGKLYKSPHALWGTLLSPNEYTATTSSNRYYIIDTDLRKQQETGTLTSALYPHRLAGLNLVSGVSLLYEGYVNLDGTIISGVEPDARSNLISTMLTLPYKELHPVLSKSTFVAPVSPLMLMLLLDPYPTKQFRTVVHNLWLNLLVDARFKSRFAASLGGVAYRSLTTLYCAGVGTESDSPLTFTVQIFTVKSLVNALNANSVTKLLLECDASPRRGVTVSSAPAAVGNSNLVDIGGLILPASPTGGGMIDTRSLPIATCIVRVLHTNIVGSTKEVQMLIEHTGQGRADNSPQQIGGTSSPALVYQQGEHPATEILPAAPDDLFLESRTTRHKRLPHLIRDLEYVFETQGTALSLLLKRYASFGGSESSSANVPVMDFSAALARLLRLLQGMDLQKRKISGGHVEYEENRWLEAFALSLNFAGCRDALVESPTLLHCPDLASVRIGMGNLFASLLREIKLYLFREDLLDNGLLPATYQSRAGLTNQEALQRSTLHVPSVRTSSLTSESNMGKDVALACATGVKMSETQLCMIEHALRQEYGMPNVEGPPRAPGSPSNSNRGLNGRVRGVMMGDWLKVPHQPLSGDPLSFHLPLHRALAKTIMSLCCIPVPESERVRYPESWWKLQVLDGAGVDHSLTVALRGGATPQSYLAELLVPTLRSGNCKIVWQLPDTSPEHVHMRKLRQYQISSDIAAIKVIHSLADLPIRCLAASSQIERHLWAKNGSSAAGMALNYTSVPLCKSFRDLDLALVQFSASGFEIGLGARRVLSLLLSRYSIEGYLKDPELQRKDSASSRRSTSKWKLPPRLSDSDQAQVLAESLFALLCVLVTELPPPPPLSSARDSTGTDGHVSLVMRRELLHALAAEPKSYSEAFSSALSGISRRDTASTSSPGGSVGNAGDASSSTSLRSIFSQVLRSIARERPNSNPSSGAPVFELTSACSDEYDPTFYHLRRMEHQHAMDVIARLRHLKCKDVANSDPSSTNSGSGSPSRRSSSKVKFNPVLPLVPPPPEAHPRFLSARLILHLPTMDAAIRRKLLFALFGGEWLPPLEPVPMLDDASAPPSLSMSGSGDGGVMLGGEALADNAWSPASGGQNTAETGNVAALLRLRAAGRNDSSSRKSSKSRPNFGPKTVQQSSVSSLEVLQLLTLQIHTLESMATLHRSPLKDSLDPEAKELSKSLDVNHYLARMIYVPESLHGAWAIDAQNGPLPSAGNGQCRGSILGVLIALWEHSYSGLSETDDKDNESGDTSSGDLSSSGGARALAADGLKWILRFVASLVDGASSIKDAARAATEGIKISQRKQQGPGAFASWLLSKDLQQIILRMFNDVSKLWPEGQMPTDTNMSPSPNKVGTMVGSVDRGTMLLLPEGDGAPSSAVTPTNDGDQPSDDFKAKLAARKSAQKAALDKMRKQQAIFAASLGGSTAKNGSESKESSMDVSLADDDEEDADECIICRCGAQDSDSPLGYLGHVQRSRTLALRYQSELTCQETSSSVQDDGTPSSNFLALQIGQCARVIGDRGCQLRAAPAMDSAPLACLPMGSVVLILNSKVSPKYDLRARRVLVRHIPPKEVAPNKDTAIEGWASIQSSQGYVILAALADLGWSRWGTTRPVLRLCGHAAHLGCVDAHCASLQQRADGDHPYDGRFAANIEEGEFLCPLCKQLSNVLLPQYHGARQKKSAAPLKCNVENMPIVGWIETMKSKLLTLNCAESLDSGRGELVTKDRDAATRFSFQLYQSMQVSWDKSKKKTPWLDEVDKWDYEEKRQGILGDIEDGEEASPKKLQIGTVLQHMRELHISWALLGHAPALAEASARFKSPSRSSIPQPNASLWPLGGVSSSATVSDDATKAGDRSNITDPWSSFSKSNRDTHAQLVDMRRMFHAACGVFDVVSLALGNMEANEEDEYKASNNGVATVGLLLLDILDGWNGGLAALLDPTLFKQQNSTKGMENWKLLTAYLASIPMHVARDGLLTPRALARSNSAAMWVVRGCPTKHETIDEKLPDTLELPPMPLSAQKVYERLSAKNKGNVLEHLGSLKTTDYLSNRQSKKASDHYVPPPFLPALASGFLYMPLLSWDLHTFSAAIFSFLLHNGQYTQCDDLVRTAQTLVMARLVQVLITPNGYSDVPTAQDFAMADDWRETLPTFTKEMREKENQSLLQFEDICRKSIFYQGSRKDVDSSAVLDAVCAATLPFVRSIILLLRTGFSIVRARRRSSSNPSDFEEDISDVLEHASTMACNDALRVMRGLACPLPSELVFSVGGGAGGWLPMIERWLASVVSLESHHGSRGQSVYFDPVSRKPVPSYAINTLPIFGDDSIDEEDEQADNKALPLSRGISDFVSEPALTATPSRKQTGGMLEESEAFDESTSESMELNDPREDGDVEDTEEVETDGEEEHLMIQDPNMRVAVAEFAPSFVEMDEQESEDEEMMEEAGEGNAFFGLSRRAASLSATESKDDDETADNSEATSDDCFADVARAAIIPYQPSLLAEDMLGPGPRGMSFDCSIASKLLYDMSHLSLTHHEGSAGTGLATLPTSFVELYGLVNKVKSDAIDENDEGATSETAICLLTGAIMKSGSTRRNSRPQLRPAGACTTHARKVGSGIGVFFLVQKCTVLMMHNNKSAYSPSLYVDENGEEDPGLRRGRPLYLNQSRLQSLEALWRNNGVPREVAQIRSTSDRVIRDNWY